MIVNNRFRPYYGVFMTPDYPLFTIEPSWVFSCWPPFGLPLCCLVTTKQVVLVTIGKNIVSSFLWCIYYNPDYPLFTIEPSWVFSCWPPFGSPLCCLLTTKQVVLVMVVITVYVLIMVYLWLPRLPFVPNRTKLGFACWPSFGLPLCCLWQPSRLCLLRL